MKYLKSTLSRYLIERSKKYLIKEPYQEPKKNYLIKEPYQGSKKKVPCQRSKKSTLSKKLIKDLKKVPDQGSKRKNLMKDLKSA